MSAAVDFTRAEERVRRDFLASGVSSLALAVARNGKILWEAAFGWADVERRIPATPDTMFSVASTTKPFTATALMILAERGRIDLDRPVNDYLPADSQLRVWVGDPSEVTVRRLFTHTAGLPGHLHFFNAEERHLKPSFKESIRRYGNIITLPGERFRYSNFGYGIMDYLVEQLSGMEFGAFLSREIFDPLGMTKCSLDIAPGLEPYAAGRYDDNGRPIPFYELRNQL